MVYKAKSEAARNFYQTCKQKVWLNFKEDENPHDLISTISKLKNTWRTIFLANERLIKKEGEAAISIDYLRDVVFALAYFLGSFIIIWPASLILGIMAYFQIAIFLLINKIFDFPLSLLFYFGA